MRLCRRSTKRHSSAAGPAFGQMTARFSRRSLATPNAFPRWRPLILISPSTRGVSSISGLISDTPHGLCCLRDLGILVATRYLGSRRAGDAVAVGRGKVGSISLPALAIARGDRLSPHSLRHPHRPSRRRPLSSRSRQPNFLRSAASQPRRHRRCGCQSCPPICARRCVCISMARSINGTSAEWGSVCYELY
jgi:hypothetical protein